MEIEMKALVTDEQIDKILHEDLSKYGFKMKEGTELLYKCDNYYSKGGEVVKKPTTVVRTRTEALLPPEPLSKILHGKCEEIMSDGKRIFITVKRKTTLPDGVETNEETEGVISEDALVAFNLAMEAAGWKPYFTKSKQSISFYMEVLDGPCKGKEIHCELVNMSGKGPYLEIEAFVPYGAKKEDISELDFESVIDAQRTIKEFFEKVLGIAEFDGRSWYKILFES